MDVEIGLVIIISTLTIVLFAGSLMFMMMAINTRHIRHRAELAELQVQRDREVITAEREATQQTLGEVGREFHDNVGQLLTVAQMGLTNMLEDGGADTRLRGSLTALEEGIEEVRRLGRTLNSDMWQHRSLTDAVSAEATRIERVGRVRVHLIFGSDPPDLSADTKTILFRVFQEIMNNALKHSGADTIEIMVDAGPPFVLRVHDNGSGSSTMGTSHSNGLTNIRRRCALIGFRAELTTAPGAGCTWTLQHQPSDAT